MTLLPNKRVHRRGNEEMWWFEKHPYIIMAAVFFVGYLCGIMGCKDFKPIKF
jgi:hypothetical protein